MASGEEHIGATGVTKRFLYVNRRAPHGTIYAVEALEALLVGALFNQRVSVLFLDDGVYQIKAGQDTTGVEMKNFSPAFRALEHYDVDRLYVAQRSLARRGLAAEDLLVPVRVLDDEEVRDLIESQDVVLSF